METIAQLQATLKGLTNYFGDMGQSDLLEKFVWARVGLMAVIVGVVTVTSTNFTVAGFIEGITCHSTGTYLTLAAYMH